MKKRDIINKIIGDGNCKAIDCDGKIHYAANFGKKCPLAKSCDTTYVLDKAKQWLIDHPEKKKVENKWFPISEFEKHFIANSYYVFLHNDNITYSFYWFPQSLMGYFMKNRINKHSHFMIIEQPKE